MSEAATALSVPPPTQPGDAHRILIIDDEAAIRESLETLLALEGYVVETAVNGEDGLESIEEKFYDLILLDLGERFVIVGVDICSRPRRERSGTRALGHSKIFCSSVGTGASNWS